MVKHHIASFLAQNLTTYRVHFWDLFRLCPPSLVGAYYLQPPDARAIFLHNDLLCNDTCSVTGGSITYWGGTNGKDPIFVYHPGQKFFPSQTVNGHRHSSLDPQFIGISP